MQIKLPAYFRLVVILLGIVLIVTIMREAKSLLVPLLISGLLAVLISPFTSWMENKGIPSLLAEFFKRAFSDHHRDKVTKVILKVKLVIQNYIKGMFVVICILAVLNSVALYSLGIKHALFFAVFAAILNVIPFLGPFLGATFPILFALLTKDSLWYPIGVFLAFYFIQLAESNIFTPKIVGGRVSMNPLMTIIALFVGNFIWGLAGMVLFIPGMAVLKVIFDEIEGMEAYGFLLGKIRNDRDDPSGIHEHRLLSEIKKRMKF